MGWLVFEGECGYLHLYSRLFMEKGHVQTLVSRVQTENKAERRGGREGGEGAREGGREMS